MALASLLVEKFPMSPPDAYIKYADAALLCTATLRALNVPSEFISKAEHALTHLDRFYYCSLQPVAPEASTSLLATQPPTQTHAISNGDASTRSASVPGFPETSSNCDIGDPKDNTGELLNGSPLRDLSKTDCEHVHPQAFRVKIRCTDHLLRE